MAVLSPVDDLQPKIRQNRNRFETALWVLSGVFLIAFFVSAGFTIHGFVDRNNDASSDALTISAFVQVIYLTGPACLMSSTLFAGLALFARAIDVNARRLAAANPTAGPTEQAIEKHASGANAEVITQPSPQRDEPIDHSVFMRPPSDG